MPAIPVSGFRQHPARNLPGPDPRYPLHQDDQRLSISARFRSDKDSPEPTLESINTQTVDSHLLPRECMPYRHAFMDDITFDRSSLLCRWWLISLYQLDQWTSLTVSSYSSSSNEIVRRLTIVACCFEYFDTFVHCCFGISGTVCQLVSRELGCRMLSSLVGWVNRR